MTVPEQARQEIENSQTPAMTEASRNSIIALLEDGRKLAAIKHAKDQLNITLKEAKHLVEGIDREIRFQRRHTRAAFPKTISPGFPLIIFSIFVLVGLIFSGIALYMYTSQATTLENGLSNPPAYTVNEEVPIFVNRENPNDIIVDTFSDRWLVIAIFGFLGGCFVLGPVTFGWLMFRSR